VRGEKPLNYESMEGAEEAATIAQAGYALTLGPPQPKPRLAPMAKSARTRAGTAKSKETRRLKLTLRGSMARRVPDAWFSGAKGKDSRISWLCSGLSSFGHQVWRRM
jgi:hypothetical protein